MQSISAIRIWRVNFLKNEGWEWICDYHKGQSQLGHFLLQLKTATPEFDFQICTYV